MNHARIVICRCGRSFPATRPNAAYCSIRCRRRAERAKVNPDLAESWEIAPDGKSITFHLREGATFASGNPVTAEDVVWSLNRLMTLNLAQASFLKTHGFTAAAVVTLRILRSTTNS